MKNVLVRLVKNIKRVLPQKLIVSLKQNSFILKAYKELLIRAGYVGTLAKWDTQKADYDDILISQNKRLGEVFKSVNDTEFIVIILGDNVANTLLTLASVSSSFIKPSAIFIQCDLRRTLQENCRLLSELNRELINELPAVVIAAGVEVNHFGFACMLDGLNTNGDVFALYSDVIVKNERGEHMPPKLFPDWSPELQLSTGYIRDLVMFRQVDEWLGQEIFEGKSIDTLLCELYLTGKLDGKSVLHLDYLLTEINPCVNGDIPPSLNVSESFSVQVQNGINRLLWKNPAKPKVSLIIPTKNGKDLVKTCVSSIKDKTTYKNYEIILVDNNSDELESIAYFKQLARQGIVKLLSYPEEFNYSAINNFAVNQCDGEVIGLVNNDIEVIEPKWLEYMVGHVTRDEIGCVGAKLLFPNNTVQHAGVVMGYGGGAGHAHKHFYHKEPGYLKRLAATNNFSAVTAACLLVTREDYNAVGGLNETNLTVAFNDVDFCLKVKELGRRNVYCAEATMYHHESISRGLDVEPAKKARFERELEYLKSNWQSYIDRDPSYNSFLTLKAENFSLKGPHEPEGYCSESLTKRI